MRTFLLKHAESNIYRGGTATVVLSEYSLDRDQRICLTHECQSYQQMKEEVNRLKQELDSVLQQAERKFPTE